MGVDPTIVVTGAGGFIGRTLFPALEKRADFRVVGIDFSSRPTSGRGEWLTGPLSRLREVRPPFIVVHLAWDMRRGDARAQRAALADFREMLKIPGRIGLVALGSAEEYGSLEGELKEEYAPGPNLSAYGSAKHDAFRTVTGDGGRFVWLRPFIVYGEGQRGDMVVPYALRCILEGNAADFSAGGQLRDFIHVEDVAAGIMAAVRTVRDLPHGQGLVCNLGRGEPVKLRDLLVYMARQAGRERLFRFGSRSMREGEPHCQFAALGAAKKTLGWQASISWQEGIGRLCRNAGEWP